MENQKKETEQQEKKGFIQKIKDFFKQLKEENANLKPTMARINDSVNFCGNINRGFGKGEGDFWNGSYISTEAGGAVIYGSAQADYHFNGEDIASFELVNGWNGTITMGGKSYNGVRYIITFKDGKKAQADVLVSKIDWLKTKLNID